MIRMNRAEMQYESQIELRGETHTNEKHKQSGENLRTDDEKRSQEKFSALRRRSPDRAGQPCRWSERSSGCCTPASRSGAGLLPTEGRRPRSDSTIRWYPRIRSPLAERNERDDGWSCEGTARRSAHAGCC